MHRILIYSDRGVDGGSLKQLIRSLNQEIDPEQCSLSRIDAKALIQHPWEESTFLLIVPGGRDIFYHDDLNGPGTDKIKRFVQEGGNYLGICAGAYFACSSIEFEKGGVMQVCAERSLRFFPGVAIGPAYGLGKYSYENCRGVEAARISSHEGDCHVYFNGGCYFENSISSLSHQVISHYLDLPGSPPAVLEISSGKGKVLLSGVHIEYRAPLLNSEDAYLAKVIPLLEKSEEQRRSLFRSWLQRLGVPLTNRTESSVV